MFVFRSGYVCVLASPIGKLAPMSAVPAGAAARFPLYCTYLTDSTISHTVREYVCMHVAVVVGEGLGVGDQLLLVHVAVVVSVIPLILLLVAFNRCTLAARSLAGTFTVDCQAATLISQRYVLCMCVCV